ncbi:hypothetical protein D3C80_1651330 [compost metagenome]
MNTVGREDAPDRFRSKQFTVYDILQHFLCIFKQRRGLCTHHFISQDIREFAMQVPAAEERRPVDIGP